MPRRSLEPSTTSSCSRVAVWMNSTAAASFRQPSPSPPPGSRAPAMVSSGRSRLPPAAIRWSASAGITGTSLCIRSGISASTAAMSAARQRARAARRTPRPWACVAGVRRSRSWRPKDGAPLGRALRRSMCRGIGQAAHEDKPGNVAMADENSGPAVDRRRRSPKTGCWAGACCCASRREGYRAGHGRGAAGGGLRRAAPASGCWRPAAARARPCSRRRRGARRRAFTGVERDLAALALAEQNIGAERACRRGSRCAPATSAAASPARAS